MTSGPAPEAQGGQAPTSPNLPVHNIGEQIRSARTNQGIGVRELARRIGLTGSMISQIERGLVRPSVSTLFALVTELDLSMDNLFAADAAAASKSGAGLSSAAIGDRAVVRHAGERSKIELSNGVCWQQLSHESEQHIQFQLGEYAVGAETCPADQRVQHVGREYGYVQSGRIGATVGLETHELRPGDSISFDASTPHRLFTIGDKPACLLWLVVGRDDDNRW